MEMKILRPEPQPFYSTPATATRPMEHSPFSATPPAPTTPPTATSTLEDNTEGGDNTAIGYVALFGNTSGDFNTAVGSQALRDNETGDSNTAIGDSAGFDVTGSGNVCIGEGVFGETGVDDSTYIRNINTTAQPIVGGV